MTDTAWTPATYRIARRNEDSDVTGHRCGVFGVGPSVQLHGVGKWTNHAPAHRLRDRRRLRDRGRGPPLCRGAGLLARRLAARDATYAVQQRLSAGGSRAGGTGAARRARGGGRMTAQATPPVRCGQLLHLPDLVILCGDEGDGARVRPPAGGRCARRAVYRTGAAGRACGRLHVTSARRRREEWQDQGKVCSWPQRAGNVARTVMPPLALTRRATSRSSSAAAAVRPRMPQHHRSPSSRKAPRQKRAGLFLGRMKSAPIA